MRTTLIILALSFVLLGCGEEKIDPQPTKHSEKIEIIEGSYKVTGLLELSNDSFYHEFNIQDTFTFTDKYFLSEKVKGQYSNRGEFLGFVITISEDEWYSVNAWDNGRMYFSKMKDNPDNTTTQQNLFGVEVSSNK